MSNPTDREMSRNRRPLIAGNWKMHKTGRKPAISSKHLKPLVGHDRCGYHDRPAVHRSGARWLASSGHPIALGAQNLHWEAQGAFTGEISCGMLKAALCTMSSSAIPNGASTSVKAMGYQS
jgi:triosephosphate isomerase